AHRKEQNPERLERRTGKHSPKWQPSARKSNIGCHFAPFWRTESAIQTNWHLRTSSVVGRLSPKNRRTTTLTTSGALTNGRECSGFMLNSVESQRGIYGASRLPD